MFTRKGRKPEYTEAAKQAVDADQDADGQAAASAIASRQLVCASGSDVRPFKQVHLKDLVGKV